MIRSGITHSFRDIFSHDLCSSTGHNSRQVRRYGRIQTQCLVKDGKHVGELVDGVDVDLVNGLERSTDFLCYSFEDLGALCEEEGGAREGSCCCFRAGTVDVRIR